MIEGRRADEIREKIAAAIDVTTAVVRPGIPMEATDMVEIREMAVMTEVTDVVETADTKTTDETITGIKINLDVNPTEEEDTMATVAMASATTVEVDQEDQIVMNDPTNVKNIIIKRVTMTAAASMRLSHPNLTSNLITAATTTVIITTTVTILILPTAAKTAVQAVKCPVNRNPLHQGGMTFMSLTLLVIGVRSSMD